MTLLVDARPLDHPTAARRGIGRWVAGFLRGLAEIDAPVVALTASPAEAEVLAGVPGLDVQPWSPAAVRAATVPGSWYVATQLMLHPIPLDPVPSIVTRSGLPVAAVMYDVIPYRYPDRYLVDPNALRQSQLRAALTRTLDALLSISDFAGVTAAESLAFPLDRIRTVGSGADPRFATASAAPRPLHERFGVVADRYVVAVTGGDERKNTVGLLAAWGLLDPAVRARHRLVVATAATPADLHRWRAAAADAGVLDDVVLTGEVTDDELVGLLQHARLSVLPSTEEGFGLPVLEAVACGCVTVCSGVSALPEILDEPAACFDPHDPADIARVITAALDDEALRARLAAAGERAVGRWTWRRVALDTVAALADLGPRWPRPLRVLPELVAHDDRFGRYAHRWSYDRVEVVSATGPT